MQHNGCEVEGLGVLVHGQGFEREVDAGEGGGEEEGVEDGRFCLDLFCRSGFGAAGAGGGEIEDFGCRVGGRERGGGWLQGGLTLCSDFKKCSGRFRGGGGGGLRKGNV